jgi:hypothetical protein
MVMSAYVKTYFDLGGMQMELIEKKGANCLSGERAKKQQIPITGIGQTIPGVPLHQASF